MLATGTHHIPLKCAHRSTRGNSQQGFKGDISSQMLLSQFLVQEVSPPSSHTHRALGVPLLFCVLLVSESDISWQDAQGMLKDSACLFSPLPTILWLLLIPQPSVLLTLVWARLTQNYSHIVHTIRVLCSEYYLDAGCCYYKCSMSWSSKCWASRRVNCIGNPLGMVGREKSCSRDMVLFAQKVQVFRASSEMGATNHRDTF